ncbi:MAG TPA: methyltransferase [Vicinamibacterales bacterium]|nr:methyltransferase [Vicinamibacterales bacterium]
MDELLTSWLAELERRHLADLTLSEVARALRALSSCYVERRSKLAEGGALGSRGKRAAFALFYGPLHFTTASLIVRSLPGAVDEVREVIDLGCGTGAAGAAWASAAGAKSIRGYDRHPWAIAEATATYRHFNLEYRTALRDIAMTAPTARGRAGLRAGPGSAVVAAYAANELTNEGRVILRTQLLAAADHGARVLVIEPIARRSAQWWSEWQKLFERAGGRADEWRFPAALGATQRTLARAAGLDPRELTARTLFL